MADDFVRVEIGFAGGQILSWLVTPESTEALERKLGGTGTVTLDAQEDDHDRGRAGALREARTRVAGRLRRLSTLALRVGIVGLPNSGRRRSSTR